MTQQKKTEFDPIKTDLVWHDVEPPTHKEQPFNRTEIGVRVGLVCGILFYLYTFLFLDFSLGERWMQVVFFPFYYLVICLIAGGAVGATLGALADWFAPLAKNQSDVTSSPSDPKI